MILCRLSEILDLKNLKITTVSKKTGISRTTLTYLCQNHTKGIQYDTMDALCKYLEMDVGDLFLYVPMEISFSFDGENISYGERITNRKVVYKHGGGPSLGILKLDEVEIGIKIEFGKWYLGYFCCATVSDLDDERYQSCLVGFDESYIMMIEFVIYDTIKKIFSDKINENDKLSMSYNNFSIRHISHNTLIQMFTEIDRLKHIVEKQQNKIDQMNKEVCLSEDIQQKNTKKE